MDKSKIVKYLCDSGVHHNIRGFSYLITAIDLCVAKPDMLNRVTKGIYPAVAEAHNTTPSRAERAIRHAINTADEVTVCELCNSEFIARAVHDFEYGEGNTNGIHT